VPVPLPSWGMGISNANSTSGMNWFTGSSLGSLPGVKRLVR
jgi:hypothetical protein